MRQGGRNDKTVNPLEMRLAEMRQSEVIKGDVNSTMT